MRYLGLIFAVTIILFPGITAAQDTGITISGTVSDSTNGEPLPGVNVYISGTTIGQSTDTTGRYSLVTTRKGVVDLVFSMIGYEKKVIPVNLVPSDEGSTLSFDTTLGPITYLLESLEVRASNKEWKRNYARFEEEFVGRSKFAGKTKVANPWVMDFTDLGDGYMLAESTEPLHLVNHALGYDVYVGIDEYRWSTTGDGGYYVVYPRFVPMEPENRSQRREWERNREEAYEGSRRHFLRSLYQDRVNTNMFTIVSPYNLLEMNKQEVRVALAGREDVPPELIQVVKGYRLLQNVQVDYGRINDYMAKTSGGASQSVLSPNRSDGAFFIDDMGNLMDPASILLFGDWAKNRMGDALPSNYIP